MYFTISEFINCWGIRVLRRTNSAKVVFSTLWKSTHIIRYLVRLKSHIAMDCVILTPKLTNWRLRNRDVQKLDLIVWKGSWFRLFQKSNSFPENLKLISKIFKKSEKCLNLKKKIWKLSFAEVLRIWTLAEERCHSWSKGQLFLPQRPHQGFQWGHSSKSNWLCRLWLLFPRTMGSVATQRRS